VTRHADELARADERQVTIIAVKHYPVRELAALLQTISSGDRDRITVLPDENMNRLVVRATKQRLEEIRRLIAELDVEALAAPSRAPLMCRVYMLEIPPKDPSAKAFSLRLERSSQLPSGELLEALKDQELQVGAVSQDRRGGRDNSWEILIEGRTTSREVLKRVVEKIPAAQVKELVWNDEGFTATVPAAQVTRLPSQLQEHLRKFLGEEVQTVGYWFGSLSSPGEVRAPIGPWTFELKARSERRPDQGSDLTLEIEVNHEPPLSHTGPTRILSNSVQGKIGKPILIGYNRDSYGTRIMGAMVILPEADAARADAPGKNAP
jgi:hypothetical protein